MNEIMPVIGDEELLIICFHPSLDDRGTLETAKDIAKAQRDADRKWMVRWLEENRAREYDKGALWHCIPDKALQALKEAIDE